MGPVSKHRDNNSDAGPPTTGSPGTEEPNDTDEPNDTEGSAGAGKYGVTSEVASPGGARKPGARKSGARGSAGAGSGPDADRTSDAGGDSFNWRILAAVGLAVAIVAAVVVWFMPGGGDTQKVFTEFEETVAPQKQTSQTLIAPATQDWWKVASVLGEAGTALAVSDVPSDATWVGFSSGRAQATAADREALLTVFYIGFEDEEAATTYVDESGFDAGYLRSAGSVAQIIPFTSEFATESFPQKAPVVEGSPSSAMWRINLTDEVAYLGAQGDYAKEFTQFGKSLGISEDTDSPTIWKGEAGSVDAAFSGELITGLSEQVVGSEDGKTTKTVTSAKEVRTLLSTALETAIGPINATAKYSCDDQGDEATPGSINCVESDPGLLTAGNGLSISAGETKFGSLTEEIVTEYAESKNVDISGAISPKTLRSALAGSLENEDGPLKRIDFGYDVRAQELFLKPILGDVDDFTKPIKQKADRKAPGTN